MLERYAALAQRALRDEPPSQAEALWILDGDDAELLEEMLDGPRRFGERLQARLADLCEGQGLEAGQLGCFMFIDQFEELFTNDELDDLVRLRFTQLIRACVQAAGVWTVCAMRSDSVM